MPTVNLGPCDCCGGCGTWTDELIANVGFNFSFTQSSSIWDSSGSGFTFTPQNCDSVASLGVSGPLNTGTRKSTAVQGFGSDKPLSFRASYDVPSDALWLSAGIEIDYEMPAGSLASGFSWSAQQVTFRDYFSVFVDCPRAPSIVAIVGDPSLQSNPPQQYLGMQSMYPPLDLATGLGGFNCLGAFADQVNSLPFNVSSVQSSAGSYNYVTRHRVYLGFTGSYPFGQTSSTFTASFSVGNNPLP